MVQYFHFWWSTLRCFSFCIRNSKDLQSTTLRIMPAHLKSGVGVRGRRRRRRRLPPPATIVNSSSNSSQRWVSANSAAHPSCWRSSELTYDCRSPGKPNKKNSFRQIALIIQHDRWESIRFLCLLQWATMLIVELQHALIHLAIVQNLDPRKRRKLHSIK